MRMLEGLFEGKGNIKTMELETEKVDTTALVYSA
jgi:hypothetical protein